MKSFVFSFILIIHLIEANAQTSFKISGSIKGLPSGRATLSYIYQNQPKQLAAVIRNGKFIISGRINETQRVSVNIIGGWFSREIYFFTGNENITVYTDTTQFGSVVIKGSPSHQDFERYSELTKAVDAKSEILNKTGAQLYNSGKLTEPLKDSLFTVRDKLDAEKRALIRDFAKEHPASTVSAWAISMFFGYDPNLEELLDVYGLLGAKNQQSLYGKQIAEIIESTKKTAIGRPAADFRINDINGNAISLSSYKGKYVLVDFWASWCGPCRAENPNVVKMYNQYHTDQFDILGISLDANKEQWIKAIKTDKLEWTQLSDLKAWDSEIVKEYGFKGIPFNLLLDKEGRIIAKNLRGEALGKKLKEVLN
jgi:peroxiredoxin